MKRKVNIAQLCVAMALMGLAGSGVASEFSMLEWKAVGSGDCRADKGVRPCVESGLSIFGPQRLVIAEVPAVSSKTIWAAIRSR